MRERDLSQTELFELVAVELGYSLKSRTVIRAFLEDREPTDDQAVVLRKHFGEPAPEPVSQPVDPQPDLISSINALVKALDADREERQALTRAIAALAESLSTRPGAEASPERRAPRATAG
jgi:hypothetical protein